MDPTPAVPNLQVAKNWFLVAHGKKEQKDKQIELLLEGIKKDGKS